MKGGKSETKILGDGLSIRKLIVDVETVFRQQTALVEQNQYPMKQEVKVKQLDIGERLLQTGRDEILTSSQILDLEEKLVEVKE